MKNTNGLLDGITQHARLKIRTGSSSEPKLPLHIQEKLLKPHRSPYYFFLFMRSGSLEHLVDLRKVAISSGQVLFVLPHQVHTPSAPNSRNDYLKLSFDEDCLSELPQSFRFLLDPLNLQTITFDRAAQDRVSALFEMLRELLLSSGNKERTPLILAHLNALLTEFNAAYSTSAESIDHSSPGSSKFVEFKQLVEADLSARQAVRDFAEKLAIGPKQLYRIVREHAGISPKEYITSRTMLEAQRKLRYSNISVKELAFELGFNDPDHFSRLFKKSTGRSVSAYLAHVQDPSSK